MRELQRPSDFGKNIFAAAGEKVGVEIISNYGPSGLIPPQIFRGLFWVVSTADLARKEWFC